MDVCSPILDRQPRLGKIKGDVQDVIGVSLVILWHISLVLTSKRRCPRSSSILIKTPTLPIVYSGILLGCDRSVYLHHGLYDHPHVVFLRHCLEERPGRSRVCRRERPRSGTIDVVGRVAERPDAGQVSRPASAIDRVVDVLPEASLV